MKFKLKLCSEGSNRKLPINYQYEISSWIYNTLKNGDKIFSEWLHNRGYTHGHRAFKLFTFSQLYPERYNINFDRLELLSPNVELYLSFYMEQAAEPFILGIFKNQQFSIGDKKSSVAFRVNAIEKTEEPIWKDEMYFQCESPIVVSIKGEGQNTYAQYISPLDEAYEYYLTQNLVNKYVASLSSVQDLQPYSDSADNDKFRFEPLFQPKSRLITIKQGTISETKIRGYMFRFKISAPKELIKIGYYSGFGEKNSLGFGSVKEVVA